MGIEATPYSPANQAISEHGGAKCGAVSADPDLARLVGAWPSLTASIRAAILALLDSSDR
jgi:hypothetical protein